MRISDWSSDVCSSDLGRTDCFVKQAVTGNLGSSATGSQQRQKEERSPYLATSGTRRILPMDGLASVPRLTRPSSTSRVTERPDERRVGKELVRRGNSRWAPNH